MKKLTVLLSGFGLGLSLILLLNFNISLAGEDDNIFRIDTLSTEATRSFSSDELIKHHLTSDKTPRHDPVRPEMVMGEFLLGAGGSIGLGIAGAGLGYKATYNESEGDFLNFSGLGGAIVGYAIGSNFGCALGVFLIGNSGGETGSFGAALGGSVLGTLLGGGLALALAQGNKNADESPLPYMVILTAGQAAGAIIAFNASRENKEEIASGALLNLNQGKLSLTFPQVNLSTDSRSSSGYKISLFQAKF